MSIEIKNIVQSIGDSLPARVKLSMTGGQQKHLKCIYKSGESPYFFLVFPPDYLPENVDTKTKQPVSIGDGPKSTMLSAKIIELRGDRTLYLKADSLVDPSSLREYFRVDTAISITLSKEAAREQGYRSGWNIDGKTQDLSGSGILAIFNDEPKTINNLLIALKIPPKINIHGVGHIVQKRQLRSKKWQVALHFDSISSKNRDNIITYLLSVQRRQLRERAHAWK